MVLKMVITTKTTVLASASYQLRADQTRLYALVPTRSGRSFLLGASAKDPLSVTVTATIDGAAAISKTVRIE
jgi:hypothetical protein